MKVLHILLICLLVSLYKAANDEVFCGSGDDPAQASDCHKRKLTTDYAKCCYEYNKYYTNGKMTDTKKCVPFKQNEMDNFVSIYKSMKGNINENGGSIDKLEWNCSSNYLYISLLSLMIFLL